MEIFEFNHSIKQFMFEMLKKLDKNLYRKNVKNIISVFLFKNPDFKYQSSFLKIISFLLCFLDEKNSFFIFNSIFTKIIPNNFENEYVKNDIMKILKEILIIRKKEEEKIKKFLSQYLQNMLNCIMIDLLNFQSFFYTFNSLISSNSVVIYCLIQLLF